MTNDNDGDTVDIDTFGKVLGWFGPLEQPAPRSGGLISRYVLVTRPCAAASCARGNIVMGDIAYDCVVMKELLSTLFSCPVRRFFRVVDLLSEGWFHGMISAKESENILKVQPRGTFLVRFSNSRCVRI